METQNKEFFMRKYYLLQLRKRRYKDRYIPNTEEDTIGIFSSLKNVFLWLKTDENGNEWVRKNLRKEYFWAILTYHVNKDYCENIDFYSLKSKKIGLV